MEEQALPLSYDLAPPPTSAVSKLDRRHIERMRKRDKLLTAGEGGGKLIRRRESLVLYKIIQLWYDAVRAEFIYYLW